MLIRQNMERQTNWKLFLGQEQLINIMEVDWIMLVFLKIVENISLAFFVIHGIIFGVS